jgi:heme exporter protein B
MQALVTLIRKDLLLEARNREIVTVMASLSLILAVVLSLAIQSAFISEQTTLKLFPGLLWFIFVVTAAVASGRTYEAEIQHGAGEGVLISGVSASTVYLAKVLSGSLISFLGCLVSSISLALLLNVPLTKWGSGFIVLSALVVVGYTALSTITAAIAATSKLKGLLLPLILIPLLFPLFMGAIELSITLSTGGGLALNSFWFSLIVGLDVLYLAIGYCTYEMVILE